MTALSTDARAVLDELRTCAPGEEVVLLIPHGLHPTARQKQLDKLGIIAELRDHRHPITSRVVPARVFMVREQTRARAFLSRRRLDEAHLP